MYRYWPQAFTPVFQSAPMVYIAQFALVHCSKRQGTQRLCGSQKKVTQLWRPASGHGRFVALLKDSESMCPIKAKGTNAIPSKQP